MVIDGSDNLYVADQNNHLIRKISPDGNVATLVGIAGRASFHAGDLPGLLHEPYGLALQGRTLYITTYNAVVQVTDLP